MTTVSTETATMKAITHERYGGPEVLDYTDIPTPEPGPEQVLVRVVAASINAADYRLMRADPFLARFGSGLIRPTKWPVLGSDFAGVVEAVGEGVTELAVGDRVFGDSFADGRGSFAEHVCVDQSGAAPIPEGMSTVEAAAVPLAGITALQAVRDLGEVEAGRSVLIHGAGGGVGTMMVQIAKAYGARVTAVCGPGSVEVVRSAGADHIVDYTVDDISETADRFDVILTVNGYQPLAVFRRLLVAGGRLVTVGGSTRQFVNALLFAKLAFLFRNKSADILTIDDDKRADDLRELHGLLSRGQLRPYIDRTFPLDRAAEAIGYVEEGHIPGKVVLTTEVG